jgi:hypothetical protein
MAELKLDFCTQLTVPFQLERDWMDEGLCSGDKSMHALMFSWEKEDEDAAVEICKQCPVRALCYAWAIIYAERGVWGGSTQRERDERRPYLLDDVISLWPRLHARWAGTDAEGEAVEVPVRSGESEPVAATPEPSAFEQERARTKLRAYDDQIVPFDRINFSREASGTGGRFDPNFDQER